MTIPTFKTRENIRACTFGTPQFTSQDDRAGQFIKVSFLCSQSIAESWFRTYLPKRQLDTSPYTQVNTKKAKKSSK